MSEYNFELGQGTDKRLVFSLSAADCMGRKVAFDLTGYSAAMQLRTATFAPEADDTLTTGNGRLLLDETAGTITAVFPHQVTEKYQARTYVYDIEITNPASEISRILSGKIKVTPEVTRVDASEKV